MALTNAKNNYLTRLLKPLKDKSRFLPQEEGISQEQAPGRQPITQAPVAQKPSAMSAILGGFNRPGMEQVQQGQVPPQAPQQTGSSYQMLQMSEQVPQRDTREEELIRKRAKANAIGKGISALFGVAGVGVGGDAPVVPDLQTPTYLNQMQFLDQDYRNRLQDWTGRRFQVDAANNQIVNREIDQNIDAQNRMDQISAQGQNARQLAAERAQYELNQLLAMSEAEQIEKMQDLGIDPYSENAYGEYLQKRSKITDANLKYTQARTNWNNRPAGSGRAGSTGQTFDIPTLQRGRQQLLKKYDQEIQRLNGQLTGSPRNDSGILAQIEQLQSEKGRYSNYNPGSNELLDAEVMEAAFQMEEDGITDNGSPYEVNQIVDSPQPDQGFQWQSPNSRPRVNGANMSEPEKMSAMNQNRQAVMRNAAKIAAFDRENPDSDPETADIIIGLAQELLDLGVTDNPDQAVEMVLRTAQQNAKK